MSGNLPAVDITVAATLFASVATLQVFCQFRRAMARHPAARRPPFARRLALAFLLSCLTLLTVPAVAGLFLSYLGSPHSAAAPLTREQPVSRDATLPSSSSAAAADAALESSASFTLPPAPSRLAAPIVTSTFGLEVPAPAAEELQTPTHEAVVDEAGQAETEQAEPQLEESDSQPEELLESDVQLPLDPDLPPVGR